MFCFVLQVQSGLGQGKSISLRYRLEGPPHEPTIKLNSHVREITRYPSLPACQAGGVTPLSNRLNSRSIPVGHTVCPCVSVSTVGYASRRRAKHRHAGNRANGRLSPARFVYPFPRSGSLRSLLIVFFQAAQLGAHCCRVECGLARVAGQEHNASR
jgi:hypothetical protein